MREKGQFYDVSFPIQEHYSNAFFFFLSLRSILMLSPHFLLCLFLGFYFFIFLLFWYSHFILNRLSLIPVI